LIFTKNRLHEQHTKAPPNVVYAQLKYMWATGAKEESLNFLRQFSSSLSTDLQAEAGDAPSHSVALKHKLSELSKLLARCYFKVGEWQIEIADDWGSVCVFDTFQFAVFSHLLCREMWKISCIRIILPRTSTPLGIRHGIHGPLQILMSLAIWRLKLGIEHPMRTRKALLHTLYKRLTVSGTPLVQVAIS
jgi:hypothetical protein